MVSRLHGGVSPPRPPAPGGSFVVQVSLSLDKMGASGLPFRHMATNVLIGLSAKQLREAAKLREQIESLEVRLAKILGSSPKDAVPARTGGAAAKRLGAKSAKPARSVAHRAKLSKALKARWAKAKAAGNKSL